MAKRKVRELLTQEERARRVAAENKARDFGELLVFDLLRMIASDPVLLAAVAARMRQERANREIVRGAHDMGALRCELEAMADVLNEEFHEPVIEGSGGSQE